MHRRSYSAGQGIELTITPHGNSSQPQSVRASPQTASNSPREWNAVVSPTELKTTIVEQEDEPLLQEQPEPDEQSEKSTPNGLTVRQRVLLYSSHTLSMWNSRSYEFAAVLFTTSAYPHTLTVVSLRGLSANFASLLFSPAVGRWCNRHPSRIRTLQLCIIFQRICICVACIGWTAIVHSGGTDAAIGKPPDAQDFLLPVWLKNTIMALLIVRGMLEKLSWVGNLIIMERDWVPLLASPTSTPALHVLNADIKRIDLISKLVAPLAISGLVVGLNSLRITAILIALMQLATVVPEVFMARSVWRSSSALQSPKSASKEEVEIMPSFRHRITTWTGVLRRYISSPVFLPSVAWTIQPFSVLTLAASMTAYLLAADFPLTQITFARTLSTIVEIASSILTPLLISWFRRRPGREGLDDGNGIQPLISVGLIGLSWQLCLLTPAVVALIVLQNSNIHPPVSYSLVTGVLLGSLALSRLGPFAYALVEQQLVQVGVPAEQRIEFSGTEMALISFAELLRWGMTGIFGRPEQFKGVAAGSFGAIAVALAMFWWWTRRWRQRLIEPSRRNIRVSSP